jgi:hypothetical protein
LTPAKPEAKAKGKEGSPPMVATYNEYKSCLAAAAHVLAGTHTTPRSATTFSVLDAGSDAECGKVLSDGTGSGKIAKGQPLGCKRSVYTGECVPSYMASRAVVSSCAKVLPSMVSKCAEGKVIVPTVENKIAQVCKPNSTTCANAERGFDDNDGSNCRVTQANPLALPGPVGVACGKFDEVKAKGGAPATLCADIADQNDVKGFCRLAGKLCTNVTGAANDRGYLDLSCKLAGKGKVPEKVRIGDELKDGYPLSVCAGHKAVLNGKKSGAAVTPIPEITGFCKVR